MGDERLVGPVAEGEVVNGVSITIGMHDELHLLHGVLELRFEEEVE
jgi:hypothetical protein